MHIEITNICNLKCTFCPPKILPNGTMSLEKFDDLNFQLKPYTKELAYHMVGDPLVLSNLNEYLNISLKHDLKVNITTTANNIKMLLENKQKRTCEDFSWINEIIKKLNIE